MGKEAIVERILSDAKAEADSIIEKAQERGREIIAASELQAEKNKEETKKEIAEQTRLISEKKEAGARLESAKILLEEKIRVIDSIYNEALAQLVELNKPDCLKLTESLLKKYAEDDDEVFFASNYKYALDVASLPVIQEKRLRISNDTVAIDGGFILCGEKSDKNLSYGALLAADRDEHQAELAAKIFKTR